MNHLFEILDKCQLHHSSEYGDEGNFVEVMGMIAKNSGLISNEEISDFGSCCRARYRHQNYSFHVSQDGHIFVGEYVN